MVMDMIDMIDDEQDQIRDFFYKTMTTKANQEEFDSFMELISPSLKVQVQ